MAVEEDTYRETIISSFPGLTKKQREVARFVLDNEYFVAFAPVAEVAEKAGASTATVLRFGQAIGYQGYPQLQAAIRQRLFPRFKTTIERLEARLVSPPPENGLLERVGATDIENIKHTLELVDPVTFETAVSALAEAAGILIIGEGLSAPAGLFFGYSLRVMGLPARVVTSGGATLSVELAMLRPSDLLVGISLWRYSSDIVESMSLAKEIGARIIAITDSEVSPLVRLADYAFVASTFGIAHASSPAAIISLLNAFVAALSFRLPEQTLAAQQRRDALRKSRLLEGQPPREDGG